MAKAADISSKRLVSLDPTAWVQWLTGDAHAQALDLLSNEVQFVSRANDILIKVHSTVHGDYLVANEIQLKADPRMPLRIRSYAALVGERYELPVYPVVINILPTSQPIVSEHRSVIMGLSALQQYRVINLWELDAVQVIEGELPTLLPFVPIMRGGDRIDIVQRAVYALRSDASLAEFETFLAFMASYVLDSETILSILRWDMTVLRENPWYNEILEEGREEGREEAALAAIQRVLARRFGGPDAELLSRLRRLSPDELISLIDVVIDAPSPEAVTRHVAMMEHRAVEKSGA